MWVLQYVGPTGVTPVTSYIQGINWSAVSMSTYMSHLDLAWVRSLTGK